MDKRDSVKDLKEKLRKQLRLPIKFMKLKIGETDLKDGESVRKIFEKETTLEIDKAIRLNMCNKFDLWKEFTSEKSKLKDIFDQIDYEEIKELNPKLKKEDLKNQLLFTHKGLIIY